MGAFSSTVAVVLTSFRGDGGGLVAPVTTAVTESVALAARVGDADVDDRLLADCCFCIMAAKAALYGEAEERFVSDDGDDIGDGATASSYDGGGGSGALASFPAAAAGGTGIGSVVGTNSLVERSVL